MFGTATVVSPFQSAPPVREATIGVARQRNPKSSFNPRPPCGRRPVPTPESIARKAFQSAPPVREATRQKRGVIAAIRFQSAPPVREATIMLSGLPAPFGFQSAPPVREATGGGLAVLVLHVVSIRAPRAGGDCRARRRSTGGRSFNPRPPCGRRHDFFFISRGEHQFQSAPPVREATARGGRHAGRDRVSIRAPRAGGDASATSGASRCCRFQSAPPVREATLSFYTIVKQREIRAPARICSRSPVTVAPRSSFSRNSSMRSVPCDNRERSGGIVSA